MIRVKASKDKRLGVQTFSGYITDPYVNYVGLPAVRALFRHIKVTNPRNGQWAYAQVLDVGPRGSITTWGKEDDDDNYVFSGQRPISGDFGIALGSRVWSILSVTEKENDVDWEFI